MRSLATAISRKAAKRQRAVLESVGDSLQEA